MRSLPHLSADRMVKTHRRQNHVNQGRHHQATGLDHQYASSSNKSRYLHQVPMAFDTMVTQTHYPPLPARLLYGPALTQPRCQQAQEPGWTGFPETPFLPAATMPFPRRPDRYRQSARSGFPSVAEFWSKQRDRPQTRHGSPPPGRQLQADKPTRQKPPPCRCRLRGRLAPPQAMPADPQTF